ncbi:MAG TPA: hypothetical protein PK581_04435 [Caldisericia bacterium]|nr:hypothetical protein [Caldisericia bacterium]
MRMFFRALLSLVVGCLLFTSLACVQNLGEPYSLWSDANEHMKSYAVFQLTDPVFAETQYKAAFENIDTLLKKHPNSSIVKQLQSKERKIHLWTLDDFLRMERD